MAFLEILNVEKRFGDFVAVERFDLEIERGEFISFLGPSGCGKTTMLRVVAGFEKPTAGQLILDGRDITDVPANRRNVGMVFQSYALFPNMTVSGNIGFGLKIAGLPAIQIRQRVAEMLTLIHMEEFASRFPHQLSGGQQQRVALARALAIRPQVLLLDEPLSALDAKIRVILRQEIRSIQRKLGITTIFVTHDQEEALSISDRIVVMNKGRMEQVGAPTAIYNAPQTRFVASFVGTLNLLNAQVVNAREGRISVDGQEIEVGRQLGEGGQVAVALRPESISFANGAAGNRLQGQVDDISFLGSVVRVRVRLRDQYVHLDTFNSPGLSTPHHGHEVTLHFLPEAVMVLEN